MRAFAPVVSSGGANVAEWWVALILASHSEPRRKSSRVTGVE